MEVNKITSQPVEVNEITSAPAESWQLTPLAEIGLPPEVVVAAALDGLTTVGELYNQVQSPSYILGRDISGLHLHLHHYLELPESLRNRVEDDVLDWVHLNLPGCTVCDSTPLGPGDSAHWSGVPGVCKLCVDFIDGPPDAEQIPPAVLSLTSRPAVLQHPARNVVLYLKHLKAAESGLVQELAMRLRTYDNLAGLWPGPVPERPPGPFREPNLNPRTLYVSQLRLAHHMVGRSRAWLAEIRHAIRTTERRLATEVGP